MTDERLPENASPPSASGDAVREEDKMNLVLAYVGLLALVPYLGAKGSGYVQFHARQGLGLGLLGVVAWGIFFFPIIGFLGGVAFCGIFALSIVGIVKALQGHRWRMPFAADIADKLGL